MAKILKKTNIFSALPDSLDLSFQQSQIKNEPIH